MSEEIIRRKRNPAVATVLALVGPGLGHLYSGSPILAAGLAAAALVFANVFFLVLIHSGTDRIGFLTFVGIGLIGYVLHVGHAWQTAGQQPDDYALRRYNRRSWYLIWWLTVAILSLFTGGIFGEYKSYKTPTTSMENALFFSDWFVADMGAYENIGPARGDVAIFICPCDGTTLYVKRCAGVPGDTVEIIDKRLYINGNLFVEPGTVRFIDTTHAGEPNVHARVSEGVDSRDNYGSYVLPVGEFFMIGDNRDNSYDSRNWGFVPRVMFLGKAIRIFYSPDWDRIGKLVE